MKKHPNRLTALLLALCIVLSLAACGGGKDSKNTSQLSGTVYVPEFIDMGLDVDYINGGCCDGTNVYIVADISSEEEVTDPDTGETYTNYDYSTGIYRIPLDGSSGAVELENFQPAYAFEDGEGWYNIDDIRAGADGTIWLSERASVYTYDLPADFNEETDDKWEYMSNEEKQLQRQLDSTGTELQRVETGDVQSLLGVDYINYTVIDDNGLVYVCYYDRANSTEGIAVIQDGSVLFTLEDDCWELVRLSDGTVGTRSYDQEAQQSFLRSVDVEGKDWGEQYPLPPSSNNFYDGAGDYLFYYDSGDSLYGFKKGANEGEKLLSWSAADINVDELAFFTFLEDGRIVAMTRSWGRGGDGGMKVEIAILTATDASTLADKTILTYAGMYIDQDIRANIINFNKTNSKYRIEIRDYSEYNTADDRQAGLTKLNTEIIAGNMPDILSPDGLSLRRYAAKGYLEDLWPLIDADPDISRDTLMENVFNAASIDGKLYQVFDSFGIGTVIGSKKVVGDRMSWTLQDLKDTLATMPDGCAIFGETDTKDGILSSVLSMNLDQYVDWENGESHFDSDDFKAVLEFCNSFPAEFDYENANWDDMEDEPTRIANGRQMLQTFYMSGFNDIQMHEAIFGGSDALYTVDMDTGSGSGGVSVASFASSSFSSSMYEEPTPQRVRPGDYISYIGYPKEDGSVGSAFTIARGMAISSTCKDKEGAWSFVRQLLLPAGDDYSNYRWAFPSNKADFDKNAAKAMEKEYITDMDGKNVLDADGNPIEETKSGWGWGDLNIQIIATTQQEYDDVMELYNAIDSIVDYDTSMFEIVNEQAGPYFSGDKSLDETAKNIQDRVNLYINENR